MGTARFWNFHNHLFFQRLESPLGQKKMEIQIFRLTLHHGARCRIISTGGMRDCREESGEMSCYDFML